ncbi:MAG: SH3 domain-containing protein [Candidatus Omnitrophota bacterium]|nr:SH3 domain-containing protein [Candidatus Omnitrophota bacterium]
MLLNISYRITLIIFATCFICSTAVFGADSAIFKGQINAENINVRVDATVSSAVICTLPKGELVEVVAEGYDWYKIRLPKEAPSYVKTDLLECLNSDTVNNPGKCLSGKVIKDRINIRLGPSESAWILGKADKLTVVSILGKEGRWYKIQPVYQSYGWVNKKFISKEIKLTKNKEPLDLPVKDVKSSGALVVEGMVSPYGVVLWRKATHKLVTQENKVYFLRGDRKALDSLNYHKVKVTGKLITPAQAMYPIIQIDIVEALS